MTLTTMTTLSTAAGTDRDRWSRIILVLASVIAVAGFAWPLVLPAVPADARAAVPVVALAVVPALVIAIALLLDRQMHSATTIALLGVLTAVGAAIRIAGTGVGGLEAVFVVLILAGRAYGARFGFLLGMFVIGLSSLLWGGIGPWTPFQVFACGWVAAGAGLLPHVGRRAEIPMLIGYGIVSSYAFGLVMNFWFWPFAVGGGTSISYSADAPLGQNLAAFGLYSLVTSTLTWDTVRAVTTTIGLLVAGRAGLAALRRARVGRAVSSGATRRSSAPRGDGRRTRPLTAPDEAAAPPTVPPPSARA